MKRTLLVILALLGMASCQVERTVEVHLQALESCADVESLLRESALREMNTRLDQAKANAVRSWGCFYAEDAAYGAGGGQPSPSPTSSGGSNTSSGPSEVSGTNNQVAGVDEADFVKTDGQYIYLASGSSLVVVKSWPAAETAEVSRTALAGTARKLFVHGDRVLVYSSLPRDTTTDPDPSYAGGVAGPGYGGYQECTYGYNCQFTGDGNASLISIFDVSDRSAPRLVREITFSSSYLNARRVERGVHLVLTSPGVRFPGVTYYPSGLRCDSFPWEIAAAFEVLREENTRLINETPITDWAPSVQDTVWVNGEPQTRSGLTVDCRGFYAASIADGASFMTLASMDIAAQTPLSVSTIVSRPGAVYASESALYVAVPHARGEGIGWYPAMSAVREASTIHKFRLFADPVGSAYVASGVVKGKVLNQFAMDEHEDHLRVATTTGHVPQPDVQSTMTVLVERGLDLVTTGISDGLAPKEDIRSVRFVGKRGYMVTFKKTDPLFVFDLSDPANPRVMAELKIPGFSTYMHPMDDRHLLTIGYDADDQGSFAWFTGVLLQIFDVADPANPALLHREVIGTRGSSSEALTNHLAFTYVASKKILALPMTICEGGSGGGSYGTTMTFSGLMVFNVGVEEGFSERGRVAHEAGQPSCRNWWTDANSVVERSIVMDDWVFSISKAFLKVNHLDNLPLDLVSLPL